MPFLSEHAVETSPLFMCVTESHLTDEILTAEVQIEDYTLHRTDRLNRSGGGVCIYLPDKLTCTVLYSKSNSVCETLILKEINLDIVICLMYRPPDCKKHEFLPCVNDIREVFNKHSDSKIIFLGDLNFPEIDWTDNGNPKLPGSSDESDKKIQINAMIDMTEEFLLNQLISKPTRGQNTIDLVFTNVTSDLLDCIITKCENMSDHNIIDMRFPNIEAADCESNHVNSDTDQPSLGKLNFYRADWEQISSELKDVNWKNELKELSVEKQLETFTRIVSDICEKHTPVKVQRRGKVKSVFFKERRAMWRKRRRLITKLHRSQNETAKELISSKIEKIHCDIRISHEKEKEDEENKAIENIVLNPKFFFSYAQKKGKLRTKVGPLYKGEEVISDETEVAECLQEQFCSVFSSPKPDEQIEDIDDFFESNDDESGLNDVNFTVEEIEKAISEIRSNAACGDDGFSALLLKNCKSELSVPLYIIWRHSLDSGEIPGLLKSSKISPIHKGGLKSVPKNYRPVALTSHLIKTFEKIIRKAIMNYLEENNLMNKNQHGFTPGRSCLSQLIDHFDLLIEMMSKNNNADVIYLDFSKAFDVVDHHILLRKLKSLGIKGKVGKWIYNFLSERQQYVTVNGKMSKKASVISGVPQGSVLGPLLFLIMISDIDKDIISSIIRTFADDTKVIQEVSSPEDCQILQQSLNKVYEWADTNNMKFNITKFNLLRYGPNEDLKRNTPYKNSDDEDIQEEKSVRDLGVQMSNDLTFTEHISSSSLKCMRLVYWILRTFKTRRKDPLLKLYKSLVVPRLDYCSQLWSPFRQAEWKALEGVQRTLTSRISETRDLNYWQRLEQLKLYSVQRRYERYSIIYTYKIIEGLAPNLSANKLQVLLNDRRGRKCKVPSVSGYQCPSAVRNAREASLAVRGPKLFNILPKSIRNVTGVSVNTFKRKLDHFLSQLPDQPTVDGYYGLRACSSNSLVDIIPQMNRAAAGIPPILLNAEEEATL